MTRCRGTGPRGSDDPGFTLVELMIVVAVIAILASMAVPNLLSSRLAANEKAVIGNLRTLVSGMAQFRTSAVLDIDHDGQGEYGAIIELTGNFPVRGTGVALSPPVLSASWGGLDDDGRRFMKGYVLMLFLPGAAGQGLAELQANVPNFDPELSESVWCLYAWPLEYGVSGRRTFFVNQRGEVLQSSTARYSGTAVIPTPGAAFTGGDANRIDGPGLAVGVAGNDGNSWQVIGG